MWRWTEDGVEVVPVVLGLSNDRFVEVKDGLSEGDRLLLAPPQSEDKAGGDKRSRRRGGRGNAKSRSGKSEGAGAKKERGRDKKSGGASKKAAPGKGGTAGS